MSLNSIKINNETIVNIESFNPSKNVLDNTDTIPTSSSIISLMNNENSEYAKYITNSYITKTKFIIEYNLQTNSIDYRSIVLYNNFKKGHFYKIEVTPSEWDTPDIFGKTGFSIYDSNYKYHFLHSIDENCHVKLDNPIVFIPTTTVIHIGFRAVIGTVFTIKLYECEVLLNEHRLLGKVIDQIDDFFGTYSYDGIFTPSDSSTPTAFLKKYQIDPEKEYSANIRVGITGNQAGASYFDENDIWISSEYYNTPDYAAKIYNDVPLHIPSNAKYVILCGTTGNITSIHYPAFLFEKGELIKKVDIINDDIIDLKYQSLDITDEINSLPMRNLSIGGFSQKWTSYNGQKHVIFNSSYYKKITVKPKTDYYNTIAFLKTYINPVEGDTPDFANNTTAVLFNEIETFEIPEDCNYIHLAVYTDGSVPSAQPQAFPDLVSVEYLFKEEMVKIADEAINNQQFFINKDISQDLKLISSEELGIGYISTNWTNYGNKKHIVLPINGASEVIIQPSEISEELVIAFLSSYDTPVSGTQPDYVPGTNCIVIHNEITLSIPLQTKYISINIYDEDYPGDHYCYPKLFKLIGYIPFAYLGGTSESYPASPNTWYYETVDIHPTILENNWNDQSNKDAASTIKSGFGYMLPSSYSANGKPTKICCCFHGFSGYVTETVKGYDNWSNWTSIQTKLLNAGFLILDINGFGEYTPEHHNSDHWGNQQAVETVKKAFEFLKLHYNVFPTMNIYGYSMGGSISYSYTLNYPHDVDLVALHEPSTGYGHHYITTVQQAYLSLANRFGYETYSDAEADNFKNFIGFNLPLTFKRFDSGVFNPSGPINLNLCTSLPENTTLVGYFPKPLRIWQGTVGDAVQQALNENVVQALRNGGCDATLRLGVGLTHSAIIATGYIQDETISFLKRSVL